MCGKCENWIVGVLGLLIAVWPFLSPALGFDANLQKWGVVVGGLVIAVFAFWKEFGKKQAA